ncbi:MAG: hypothetical protein IIV02_06705 [Peptococcaceae bacterium]|nr:hypothetical protein [Peptococcaceae bacterium]
MKDYTAMPTVGYWSDMDGVEVKEIENGYVLVVAGHCASTPTSHRLKIYGDDYNEFYIRLNGKRLKLSECRWLFKIIYSKSNNL